MLKTNSKQAKQNIREYILNHCTFESYGKEAPETIEEASTYLMECFTVEKSGDWYLRNYTEQERFIDWLQGLPSVFDSCYYYNRPAVDDLGNILEETPEERERFTEEEAERMLSQLIYREVRGCAR